MEGAFHIENTTRITPKANKKGKQTRSHANKRYNDNRPVRKLENKQGAATEFL